MSKVKAGKSYLLVRLSTVDLLVLTRLDQIVFKSKIVFSFFTKQATLIRRTTCAELSPQLLFHGESYQIMLMEISKFCSTSLIYLVPKKISIELYNLNIEFAKSVRVKVKN